MKTCKLVPQTLLIVVLAVSGALQCVTFPFHPNIHLTVWNSVFQTCILFLQPNEQLLKKGGNSQDTSDNHRVRADFLEGKDYAGIDVRVIGDSTCTATHALQAVKVHLLLNDAAVCRELR